MVLAWEAMLAYFPALVLLLLGTTYADYQCVCNYDKSADVFSSMTSRHVVASMSEFQCQPLIGQVSHSNWARVDISGQGTAYVQTGGMVLVQTCPGDPPTTPATLPPTTTHKPTPTPINGQWGSWSSYTACSKTCGGGTRDRHRTCNHPAPAFGGASCQGPYHQTAQCNTNACPVNGHWSSWTTYGTCSQTCGGGIHVRTRSCTHPAPAHGGAACQGSDQDKAPCNTKDCPDSNGQRSFVQNRRFGRRYKT